MPSWLPSIPYRPAREGYWSPVTSTINWCEEDYYVTIYSAEIVNTLTNLLFVWLGIKGIVNWVRNRHDNIFLVAYVGYLIVGSGSLCFHSTLKYPMQLVDELSMIYTTCLMCFAIFAYDKSTIYSTILGIFLLSLSLSITLYYHYLQEPVFHQVMYALLTAIVLFRSIWLMEVNIRPTLRKKRATAKSGALQQNGKAEANRLSERETARMDARDAKIVKTMWIMVAYGLSVFLGGFAFWALDLKYCSTLRRWRREVGLPWGVVLEGHGWWHLMTGVGGYFYIVWGTWLRHCLNDRQDEFELIWPRLVTSMPVVERKERAGATAANGMGKKEL